MALARERLAGAAAALAVGGVIILGSAFLVSQSYTTLPALFNKPQASPNVIYVQSFPMRRDSSGKPIICAIEDGHSPNGRSASATVPCYGSETAHGAASH
jgi:hypothetical protein